MSSNVGANASDIGLIVQGTLIFLSACVAVIGYIVQSKLHARAHEKEIRLARAEHHKEAKLKQLREILTDVIGPMQGLAQQGQSMCYEFGISATDHEGMMTYCFEVMGGKEEAMSHMAGKAHMFTNEPFMTQWLLKKIKADPEGIVAKDFRSVMKCALRLCYIPLSDLIRRHMNTLNLPTREAFVLKYPALKGNPQLRKILLLQLVNWTGAMEDIVNEEWSKGDYTQLFPRHQCFPYALVDYLIMLMDSVREEIQAATAGTMVFNTVSAEQEQKDMGIGEVKEKKRVGRESPAIGNGGGDEKNEQGEKQEASDRSKSSRYAAVGAAAGATVAGAAASVMNA